MKHAREVELLSDQIQNMLQQDASENKLSVRKQFEKFDVEKDGCLTFLQLNKALSSLGFQASPDVIQNIIARFDKNSDGKVSLDEFFDFFSVIPKKAKGKFNRQRSSLVNISSSADDTIKVINENVSHQAHDEIHHDKNITRGSSETNEYVGSKSNIGNGAIDQLSREFKASIQKSEKRLDDKFSALQAEIQRVLSKLA